MFLRLSSLLTCVATASLLSSGVHSLHLKALSLDSVSAAPASAAVPVQYTVNGDKVESVALALKGAAPRSLRVQLSVDGTWYRCETIGKAARCLTPGLTVAAIDKIAVAEA
jgi:hypothetical protein